MTSPTETDRSGPTTASRRSLLILVGVWVAWGACVLAFQELVVARLQPDRPDHVLVWTAEETGVRRFGGRPYLAEPTLNTHVAFDSEYYISIAVVGYDDPDVPQYDGPDGDVPLNYAFLPAYPLTMRVVAAPLGWLGMDPIPAAVVAGVAVSLLATLIAMLALYSLARRHLGEGGALRAAFYLLIFPSGFFLAQVYTEALFLALSFGALALIADRRPLLAGVLAIAAVLTRPVGIALVLPIGIGLVEAVLRSRRAAEPAAPPWRELAVCAADGPADHRVQLRLLGGLNYSAAARRSDQLNRQRAWQDDRGTRCSRLATPGNATGRSSRHQARPAARPMPGRRHGRG